MKLCARVIAIALSVSLLTPAHAGEADACHRLFAGLVSDRVGLLRSQSFVREWSTYHELLSRPMAPQLSRRRYRETMKAWARQMAEAYAQIEPEFPKDDFLAHFNAEMDAQMPGFRPSFDGSFGAFMEMAYSRFTAQYHPEGVKLFRASSGLRNYLGEVMMRCGRDPLCFSQEVRKLGPWMSDSLKGTCLAMSPHAVSALIQDTVLNLTVLGAIFFNQMSGRLEDFPFPFLINGTLWSTILSEVNCRKAVAATHQLPFGRALADVTVPTYGSQVWRSVRQEVADWKWYPASAATLVGLSYLSDEIKGTERPDDYYSQRLIFSVIYNALSGPPRRVLLIDPIFKKAFPAIGKWINERVASGKMAELVTRVTSSGTDYGLRYQEWTLWGVLYSQYMNATVYSDKPVVAEPSPQSSK